MSDTEFYTFKINDFTPDSMPFGRLVEYYLEIKKMLGMADNLHLVDVVEGSHGSTFKVDRSYESGLTRRMIELRSGDAPQPAQRAQQTINAMLAEDGTSGSFFDSNGTNVIEFPGKRLDEAEHLSIRGSATFVGELYHIAGTGTDVKIRINTENHGVVYCATSKEIAKSLREFLFEYVKVSGRGIWAKTPDGQWVIDKFQITDFTPVFQGNLRETVNRLRAFDVTWPADPLEEIAKIEERNGTAH